MRACRKLAALVAVLVWLGALVYLLELSRRKLPEPGGAAGGEAADSQVSARGQERVAGSVERVIDLMLARIHSHRSMEIPPDQTSKVHQVINGIRSKSETLFITSIKTEVIQITRVNKGMNSQNLKLY